MNKRAFLVLIVTGSLGCGGSSQSVASTQAATAETPSTPTVTMTPSQFNQTAVHLNLPIYWYEDTNHDTQLQPNEVRSLLFYPTAPTWVENGEFTADARDAITRIAADFNSSAPTDERARLVRLELDQGRPTLVYNDLRGLSEPHKKFMAHMLTAIAHIDAIYGRQMGMPALSSQLPPNDTASASLFRRNWGPRCQGKQTEANPACSAIPGAPTPKVDVYPEALQNDAHFCDQLAARPDATTLLSPFTVVRQQGEALAAQPYSEAYSEDMRAISAELTAAADTMTDPDEQALVRYLRAAAQSFIDNNWQPADEAWAAMNVRNSKWYLRVGPDEVYWEPCSRKAGFHMTLALINRGSLEWQDRLAPLQQDMEGAIAHLAGRGYRARTVTFHLPDFIDIVANSGDDRSPFGATIGQSLPNWGPVSNEGRGRTVAMSNLYTDPESDRIARENARSLLTEASLQYYTDDPGPGLLSTILHEATHNLGPSNDYHYRGKSADDAFGGAIASMLEELKAQTGALYLLNVLHDRGVIDENLRRESILNSVTWALGHMSEGMYTPSGERKAYSQLAAIQIGFLMDAGVIHFNDVAAANGTDHGAFEIDYDAFPAAAERLMAKVAAIKATNQVAGARELIAKYVDTANPHQQTIAERLARFPRASFVYSVDL